MDSALSWPSHDSLDLWWTALKSSLPSCETSSFDEIKHLSSVRNLRQSGRPFNIMSSEWPMLIVTVYVTHAFHILPFTENCCPAQRHFDSNGDELHLLHILWQGISNGQGQDSVLQVPMHAQAGMSTDWPAVFLQELLWVRQHFSQHHNFALKICSQCTRISVFKTAYIIFTFRRGYNYPFFKK